MLFFIDLSLPYSTFQIKIYTHTIVICIYSFPEFQVKQKCGDLYIFIKVQMNQVYF